MAPSVVTCPAMWGLPGKMFGINYILFKLQLCLQKWCWRDKNTLWLKATHSYKALWNCLPYFPSGVLQLGVTVSFSSRLATKKKTNKTTPLKTPTNNKKKKTKTPTKKKNQPNPTKKPPKNPRKINWKNTANHKINRRKTSFSDIRTRDLPRWVNKSS